MCSERSCWRKAVGGVDKFDGWRESGMDAGSAGGGEVQHSGLNQMGGKKRRAETGV